MRSDIIGRLREIIQDTTDERRRLKHLEEETGIPDRNWKQVWSGRQRPTVHMIEAISRRWPQYAFWLATGITDEANGHIAPEDAWTMSSITHPADKAALQAAIAYLTLKLYLQEKIYGESIAYSRNWIENKNPSPEEAQQATEEHRRQIDRYEEGHEKPIIGKRKHSDLDEAIASIARKKWIKEHSLLFSDDPKSNESSNLLAQLDALHVRRREK